MYPYDLSTQMNRDEARAEIAALEKLQACVVLMRHATAAAEREHPGLDLRHVRAGLDDVLTDLQYEVRERGEALNRVTGLTEHYDCALKAAAVFIRDDPRLDPAFKRGFLMVMGGEAA